MIDDSTEITHACATEEEVYELLGMQYIPPELRENRGELEAARKGKLPELVELGDIRGELHCHTVASDGRQTIEQMAAGRARARLRLHRDHRPLGHARLRQRRDARRAARDRSSGARAERALDGFRCSPAPR